MTRVASLYLPDWPIDRLRQAERRAAPPAEADALGAMDAIGPLAAAERALQCSVPKEGGWRPGARWARSEGDARGSGLADSRAAVAAAVEALPAHRRPPQRELGRRTEAAEHPFADGARGGEWLAPEQLDAAIAALPAHQRPSFQQLSRRSEVTENPFADEAHPFRPMPPDEAGSTLAQRAAQRPVHFSGRHPSDQAARRNAREGHAGEAGYLPVPSLAQLAAMPAVQFPGEGPHPDNHGKSEPTAPTYGQGRFFQTGRTLGSIVARVCRDDESPARAPDPPDEPPLVTTHKVGSRVEIAAANRVARALGLAPGMALTLARAQVPGLEVRAADPTGDRVALARLADRLARRWTPIVAITDADGLVLDLTGVAHLHGGEARLARRLVRLLARHGVRAHVAVADTVGAAWALARYGSARSTADTNARVRGGPQPGGNGQGSIGWADVAGTHARPAAGHAIILAAPGTHEAQIAPLPVAALRLADDALELLARLGIDRVGQLLALPRAPLVRRFGRAIVTRLDQATGRAPEPLDPVVPREPIVVTQRFAEPIATAEAIEHWLRLLVPRLTGALAEAGRGARMVALTADRVDGVPQRLTLGVARPTRDALHLLRLMLRRIETIDPGYGIDALTLRVHRDEPLGPVSLAPHLAEEQPPDLGPLVDLLANRIGTARLWRMSPLQSDVPERALAAEAPLDPPPREGAPLARDDVRRLDARPRDHAWHPRWPRPARLLRRPEPVDDVMALLPDKPPIRFTWRGQTHRVVCADGPERIGGEWWRRPAERLAIRDYFQVEDEAGDRFWLYRRGDGVRPETGDLSWHLHGRFG